MKRKMATVLVLLGVIVLVSPSVMADKPIKTNSEGVEIAWDTSESASNSCTRIQEGTLLRSDGVAITVGFDEWGYNYQAHMFKGGYCDAYRDAAWCQPWKDVELLMKWNDAWLANVDCDGDGLLDRHFGYDSYIGSGAWETNHQKGTYEMDGHTCQWEWFEKIVAAPADATLAGGIWYNPDGVEIGPGIWGEFAIIQSVYNDPCGGFHGVEYLSSDHAGFGNW
jgi:hypothetical protein